MRARGTRVDFPLPGSERTMTGRPSSRAAVTSRRRGTRGRFVSRMISERDFTGWGNLFFLK
jgi:hypothetical protein